MNLVERSHHKLPSTKADRIYSCLQLTGMGYIWSNQSIQHRSLPELVSQGPLHIFRAWFTQLISYFYIRVKWIMFLSCLFLSVDLKKPAVTSSRCRWPYFITDYISGFQKNECDAKKTPKNHQTNHPPPKKAVLNRRQKDHITCSLVQGS